MQQTWFKEQSPSKEIPAEELINISDENSTTIRKARHKRYHPGGNEMTSAKEFSPRKTTQKPKPQFTFLTPNMNAKIRNFRPIMDSKTDVRNATY